MNILFIIEYDGTNYSGWQKIPGKYTIEGVLEERLSRILNENINITGASRTDAGVHALGQIASFKTGKNVNLQKLKNSLNRMLPKDIVIKKAKKASEKFNARHSAKSKTYRYVIYNSQTPQVFKRNYSLHFRDKLDLPAMRKAAKYLKGNHDFKCFSAQEERTKTKRTLKSIKITKSGKYINIDFTGNSFLRRMVRVIVGFLLNVGIGKYQPLDIKRAFSGKFKFSPLAAQSHGLFLVRVKY